jgi:hypothetical protein
MVTDSDPYATVTVDAYLVIRVCLDGDCPALELAGLGTCHIVADFDSVALKSPELDATVTVDAY